MFHIAGLHMGGEDTLRAVVKKLTVTFAFAIRKNKQYHYYARPI